MQKNMYSILFWKQMCFSRKKEVFIFIYKDNIIYSVYV